MTKQIGPYELLDRISSGGMGEIYLARLTREGGFQKVVALKRILPHLAREANFIKMFEAEARLSAQLNHANVVHVYDYGRDADGAWIAMEYVDGYDLRGALDLAGAPEKGMPHGLALFILESCAAALDYAYRRNGPDGNPLKIIHRDMSPQNVLLSLEGEVKITDFGLAKACSLDTWSLSGMLKGKLAYMAPEQVMSGQVDSRSDIFATGIVLYEMLTGRRVYPPDTAVARLMDRVRRAEFEPMASVAPDTAPELLALVDRCLAEQPEDRFESASDLAVEARRVATELGCHAAIQDLAVFVRGLNPDRVSPAAALGDGTAISDRPIAMDVTQVVQKNDPQAETRLEDAAAGVADTMALSASDLSVIKGDDAAPPPTRSLLPALLAIAALAALIWWIQPAETDPGEAQRPVATATPPVKVAPPVDAVASQADVAEQRVEKAETRVKPVAITSCDLSVVSHPQRARVTLDGNKLRGRTPLQVSVLPGKHTIELERAGFAIHTGQFTCERNLPGELSFTLPRKYTRMVLNGKSQGRRAVGKNWSLKRQLGEVQVKLRVVAREGKPFVVISTRPYASPWLKGRSISDAGVAVAAGAMNVITFKRNGISIGSLRLKVVADK